jgi:hypothetical protein
MINITTKMTVDSIRTSDEIGNSELSNALLKLGKREVKDSGAMWRLVCSMVLRNPSMLEHEKLEDFMNDFGELLALQNEHTDVPIATKGKGKGKPAWRSWDVTKPRWQYANYIFNAIENQGNIDLVFPPAQPLPTLAAVRKLQKQKAGELPLDTVKRCLEMINKKLDGVEDADVAEINNLVATLSIEVATKLADINKNAKVK